MIHEYFDLHVAGLMVACVRETYGKSLPSYMKSEKEKSLRSCQPNLSGTQIYLGRKFQDQSFFYHVWEAGKNRSISISILGLLKEMSLQL